MPKTETLASARNDIIQAAVHAAAHLVLHITGEKRLVRSERAAYVKQLKQLLEVADAP